LNDRTHANDSYHHIVFIASHLSVTNGQILSGSGVSRVSRRRWPVSILEQSKAKQKTGQAGIWDPRNEAVEPRKKIFVKVSAVLLPEGNGDDLGCSRAMRRDRRGKNVPGRAGV
jgi:hypothetical protein